MSRPDASVVATGPSGAARRRVPLVAQLVGAIAIGVVLGFALGRRAEPLGEAGALIVRMLKALATPLVFFAVVDAFCRAEVPARRGARMLLACGINAVVACGLALAVSNVLHVGSGVDLGALVPTMTAPAANGAASVARATPGGAPDPMGAIGALVPESLLEPFVKNQGLTIVLLAVLFGLALRRLRAGRVGARGAADDHADAVETLARGVDGAFRLLTVVLEWVVRLVPLAVLGVVARVVGTSGLAMFRALGLFVGVVTLGLALHVFVYYGLVLRFALGRSPLAFFRAAAEAILTALSTGSSMATLPVTLRTLGEKLRVTPESARLAACVGTNFNHDGIMLYEVAAALFVAQASGIHLGLGQQLSLALTAALAAAGIAGVPEAGLITLALVLGSAGLPLSALPLLLTVDWLLGRLRAATNVTGDLVVATLLDAPFGQASPGR